MFKTIYILVSRNIWNYLSAYKQSLSSHCDIIISSGLPLHGINKVYLILLPGMIMLQMFRNL